MTAAKRPHLLSLLGPSNAGKTTLAVRLVERWSAGGLAVGYLKHASHGFEMDRPGKDSARATAAGAVGVGVAGPEGTAFLEPVRHEDPRLLATRFLPHADVVVVEGFRDAALPAVVLAGADGAAAVLETARGEILAVVAPRESPAWEAAGARGLCRFERADESGLLSFLDGEVLPRA
jgi:molybdopterin-guanine dinucleotide biosynthesis protein B